jgi:hypothetical protein
VTEYLTLLALDLCLLGLALGGFLRHFESWEPVSFCLDEKCKWLKRGCDGEQRAGFGKNPTGAHFAG